MNPPLLRIALPRVSAIVCQGREAAPSGSDLRGKAAIASRRIAALRAEKMGRARREAEGAKVFSKFGNQIRLRMLQVLTLCFLFS
jgi:hypothetical protein